MLGRIIGIRVGSTRAYALSGVMNFGGLLRRAWPLIGSTARVRVGVI